MSDKELNELDQSFLIDGEVCSFVNSNWYLNEELVYISSFDDAYESLKQKIEAKKIEINSLKQEVYETEQAIKAIKQHNEKIKDNILEKCVSYASSKKLTNDPSVLELRKTGTSIANKYIFVLENNDIVALGNKEIEVLKLFDNELIDYGNKSAEQLKEILEGMY